MSKNIDKNYQLLQFKSKIFLTNGLEFQSFFEKLVKKHNPLFKKVPSGGGDGGNDGWIKETGTYYQVYSPIDTSVKDADAAKKLKDDFDTLNKNWDRVNKIKEYFFVYNDKYNNAHKAEKKLVELEKNYPNIKFKLLLSEDLEKIFSELDDDDKYELGFHVDKRQIVDLINEIFEKIERELDKDNLDLATQLISSVENTINLLLDDNLLLELKLLNAKVKQKLELFDSANKIYQDLIKNNPDDPRSYLYLAENKLRIRDLKNNQRLLKTAEKINPKHWLLTIEKIVRAININEYYDISKIDTKKFPEEKINKANYYRLYSILMWRDEKDADAESFLKESMKIHPNKITSHIQEIELLSHKIITSEDPKFQIKQTVKLQKKVSALFLNFPNIGNRNNAAVKIQQLLCYKITNNPRELEKTAKEIFNLSLKCYFDNGIDSILATLLKNVSIPKNDLEEVQKYVSSSIKKPSDRLNLSLSYQFCLKKSFYIEGLSFFKKIGNQKYIDLIESLISHDFEKTESILKQDQELTIFLAQSLNEDIDNRKKIIDLLFKEFSDLEINKEKLLLLVDIDNKDVTSALKKINAIGIDNFKGMEVNIILDVLHYAEAWELEAISLKKIIKNEKNLSNIVNYKVRFFNALLNLKNYKEIINIGEELLTTKQYLSIISTKNIEIILAQTVLSLINRSVVDSTAFSRAENLINKTNLGTYSLEFLIGVKAELFLVEKKPNDVIDTVIEAAKTKKVFTKEEYAKLYFLFTRLSNLKGLDLISLKKVKINTFIKFKNDSNWVYFGDENNLDAIKLSKNNKIYIALTQKRINENIEISNLYGSKVSHKKIELIFPIEKYLFWKSVHSFHKLANEGLLDGVVKIETPENEDGLDPQYLLRFMKDQEKRKSPFFDMYLKKRMPLALLSLNEGSISGAIGKIQQEQAGFINFSTGNINDFELQKTNVKKLLGSTSPLYLDATSVLVLSESGLIGKVFDLYENIKIPQSVVNFLIDIANKFNYTSGQSGYMSYARGKIILSNIDEAKQEKIKNNFQESIKIIESNPGSIEDISLAVKQDCFTERELLPESVDACILAQKNKGYVLTDDYLYLHFNNFETKKPIPKYFSSLALVKAMHEMGQIKFEEYLNFFSYLSSYRYRFLHFDTNDMERALFGDGKIKTLSIDNILKFNLSLTLSENYGVVFENAFKVVAVFLYKLLEDESVTPEIIKQVFQIIVDCFPTKLGKKEFSELLSSTCRKVIESKKRKALIQHQSSLLNQKLDDIELLVNNFSPGLWIPK